MNQQRIVKRSDNVNVMKMQAQHSKAQGKKVQVKRLSSEQKFAHQKRTTSKDVQVKKLKREKNINQVQQNKENNKDGRNQVWKEVKQDNGSARCLFGENEHNFYLKTEKKMQLLKQIQ